VTELVTGFDLVHEQLRIAAGERLSIAYAGPRGHAIECRITAEDPSNDFLPVGGRVQHLRAPAGTGVRWDAGVVQGTEVGLHYDSLIAKLVVHAENRELAIARMSRALDELVIEGVPTIAPLHRRVMDEPGFRAGEIHTGYLEEHPEVFGRPPEEGQLRAVAVVAALLEERDRKRSRSDGPGQEAADDGSSWRRPPGGWKGRGWGVRG
jgi:acetyl/propionyl-CoA carboxylase alpha subunit